MKKAHERSIAVFPTKRAMDGVLLEEWREGRSVFLADKAAGSLLTSLPGTGRGTRHLGAL